MKISHAAAALNFKSNIQLHHLKSTVNIFEMKRLPYDVTVVSSGPHLIQSGRAWPSCYTPESRLQLQTPGVQAIAAFSYLDAPFQPRNNFQKDSRTDGVDLLGKQTLAMT
jgi:hypothetical protein